MTIFSYTQVIDLLWDKGPMTIAELAEEISSAQDLDVKWTRERVRSAITHFRATRQVDVHSAMKSRGGETYRYMATGVRYTELDHTLIEHMIIETYLPADISFDKAKVAADLSITHQDAQDAISRMRKGGVLVKTRRQKGSYNPCYRLDPRKARWWA